MKDILTAIKTWLVPEPKHQSPQVEYIEYQKDITICVAMIIFTCIFSAALFINPINRFITTQPDTVFLFWVSATGMQLYLSLLRRYEYIKKLYQPTPTDKEVPE